jgi:hypothetical protein
MTTRKHAGTRTQKNSNDESYLIPGDSSPGRNPDLAFNFNCQLAIVLTKFPDQDLIGIFRIHIVELGIRDNT